MDDFVFDKKQWQQNAFEEIKASLFFSKNNKEAGSFNNAKENHLVVIYGVTQVGKTTLILNMIGIQDECFNEVYDTLRAGQEVGSSSTSTAIIYSKSDSDKYRLAIREINSIAVSEREEYDSKGLIERLKQIRTYVENGKLDPQDILDIAIPQQYFESEIVDYNISILDLPGDMSKNTKEMPHVSKLLARYIPIASTCIIASESGYNQSLESLELPNMILWKDMHHRFVIVITRAYSDDTIRSFFKNNSSYREEDFYEYVQKTYEESIRGILGAENKTEVYPIDLGESLSTLCTEYGLTDNAVSAIKYAKNTTLRKLRESINSREGNQLSSALDDLKVVVTSYFNAVSEQLEDELCVQEDEIKRLNARHEQNNNVIQGLRNAKKDFSDKNAIDEKLSKLSKAKVSLDSESWWNAIDKHYKEQKWYWPVKKPHIKSVHRIEACNFFYYYISKRVEEYISNTFTELINSNSADEIIDAHCLKKQNDLFHFDRPIGALITRDRLQACVNEVAAVASEAIQESIETTIADLKKMREPQINSEKAWSAMLENRCNYLAEIESNIKKCENEIKRLSNELTDIKNKKQRDVDTLNQYLRIARNAYLEYRNEMISYLNSKNTSPAEKTKLLLEVGVLDNDYLKITGGTEN